MRGISGLTVLGDGHSVSDRSRTMAPEVKRSRRQIIRPILDNEVGSSVLKGVFLEPEEHSRRLMAEALNHVRQRQFGEALRLLTSAIELTPDVTVLHVNRANIYRELGHVLEAYEDLAVVLRQNPNDAIAQYNIALILLDLGRPEDAILHLTETVSITGNPSWTGPVRLRVSALSNRSAILNDLGRPEEGLVDAEHALLLSPLDQDIMVNRARSLQELGRIEEAISCLREAIKLDPDNVACNANLGMALAAAVGPNGTRGDLREALDYLERALSLDPNDCTVLRGLANISLRIGLPDNALRLLDRAISLDPDDWTLHHTRALALRRLGRDSEADEEQGQASRLKHYPGSRQ